MGACFLKSMTDLRSIVFWAEFNNHFKLRLRFVQWRLCSPYQNRGRAVFKLFLGSCLFTLPLGPLEESDAVAAGEGNTQSHTWNACNTHCPLLAKARLPQGESDVNCCGPKSCKLHDLNTGRGNTSQCSGTGSRHSFYILLTRFGPFWSRKIVR